MITFQGKTQSLPDWAEELSIPLSTLESRIYRLGWKVEKALSTPPRRARWPGVFRTRSGRYAAQLTTGRRGVYLGSYDDPETAHRVHLAAKVLHRRGELQEFLRLNPASALLGRNLT